MAAKLPIHVRKARYGDLHFCYDAWIKSTRHDGTNVRVPSTVYCGLRRPIIKELMSRYDVHIASWDDDDGQIYGFLCSQKVHGCVIVYYLYTKSPFRGMGIARMLCQAAGISDDVPVLFAGTTRMSPMLKERYGFVHAPDLCFYGAHGTTEHPDVVGVCDYARGEIDREADRRRKARGSERAIVSSTLRNFDDERRHPICDSRDPSSDAAGGEILR